MKKCFFIAVCCCIVGFVNAQKASAPPERRGGWFALGDTYAMHNTDHDVIQIKEPVANYGRLKVTVRDLPLTITKMKVVYDSGEDEVIDAPIAIPKNGESDILEIQTGDRNIKRIDFWYDSADFKRGKAEVTVFARR
ncbi:hypothetical protein ACX0HA_04955 [Flavobacterium hauense]